MAIFWLDWVIYLSLHHGMFEPLDATPRDA